MPAQKERVQQALLATILAVIALVMLVWFVPNVSLFGLLESVNTIGRQADADQVRINRIRTGLTREETDRALLEQETKQLALLQEELLPATVDPYFWIIEVFKKEASAFGVTVTSWKRGAMEPLPEVQLIPANVYRGMNMALEGNFVQIGRFLAHLENEYPLMVIRSITIAGTSPYDPKCMVTLELSALVKKGQE